MDVKTNTIFEVLNEILMTEDKPSQGINRLSGTPEFQKAPFHMLLRLKKTDQSEKYHPEGNVWNHTMMVVDEAAAVKEQATDPNAFMWAALLHDIGKPDTTVIRKGRITSYNHDKLGARLSKEFMVSLGADTEFVEKVSNLVLYHMHMLYVLQNLPYADTKNLLNRVDIYDIALLCRCDRLGRMGADRDSEIKEAEAFLHKLEGLQANTYRQ